MSCWEKYYFYCLQAPNTDKPVLNAERRLNIAIDVARGISALHSGGNSVGPIVHRDVKP